MKAVWLCIGWLAVALAIIGAILPLMPSVVFLLIAAYAFSRSSERIHTWITTHKTFGPPIRDWTERGAISPKAKRAATIAICASVGLSWIFGAPIWAIGLQVAILAGVLSFILTRPGA